MVQESCHNKISINSNMKMH